VPEYLRTPEEDQVRNFMDYGIQLGRRFRALKLWMVLRAFGSEGLRQHLRAHIALAQRFQGWIEESPDFELLAPVPFSVVCFRQHPCGLPENGETEAYLNRLNERLLDSVNRTGEVFLSHTQLNGRFTLRLAIGNVRTTEAHVRRAWDLLQEHAGRLDAELRPAALKAQR
jgi:aromatic-L-amino-acid decarboxylase